MVLGQPWLFSQSVRIEYLHELGMKIQLWEQGQRDGQSILINLPLVNAPQNVMPARFKRNRSFQSRSGEVVLASPGDGFNSHETPKFLDKAEEVLTYLV